MATKKTAALPYRWANMDAAFGHWLAGFIDGEGCFLIGRQGGRSGSGYRPSFQLKIRADDRRILDEIVERTGIGYVRHAAAGGQGLSGRGNPQLQWRVVGQAERFQLVQLLDRYPLRAKKARDYAIWRVAVLELQRNPHRPGPGKARDWAPFALWMRELRAVRAYVEVA